MFPRSRTNYTYARPILEGTIAGDTVQELANRFTVGKYSVVNLETWETKGTSNLDKPQEL